MFMCSRDVTFWIIFKIIKMFSRHKKLQKVIEVYIKCSNSKLFLIRQDGHLVSGAVCIVLVVTVVHSCLKMSPSWYSFKRFPLTISAT